MRHEYSCGPGGGMAGAASPARALPLRCSKLVAHATTLTLRLRCVLEQYFTGSLLKYILPF